ncbi:MAG: hypothetical protein QM796_12620 [Chthoniobacteraceae bacterium]
MTSIIVVLPAPFGPMMQRSSPALIDQAQLVQRLEAVEADGDVVEVEDRAVREVELPRRDDAAVACAARRRGARPALLVLVLAFVPGCHQVGRHARFSFSCPAACARSPTMPCGRNNVTAMNSAPRK